MTAESVAEAERHNGSTTASAGPAVTDNDVTADADNIENDIADAPGNPASVVPERRSRRSSLGRTLAFVVLPGIALLLAVAAGYLRWWDSSARNAEQAAEASVRAATDATASMLSYRPDNVEKNLDAARSRMTGAFRDSYSSLTNDVVIPGAKQRQISAVATVRGAASIAATDNHAVVLLFVDQTTVIGTGPPTNSTSTVRVTLDKVDGQWLIAQFDPI